MNNRALTVYDVNDIVIFQRNNINWNELMWRVEKARNSRRATKIEIGYKGNRQSYL